MWRPAKHLSLICETLEKVERGELKQVMFFLPPRHGKSYTVTETFPSWFIGRNPDRRVIEVSYSDDFANKFGRSNREKLWEFGQDIFGVKVDPGHALSTDWGIYKRHGGMISAGLGGRITGEGADLMVIDDPIKNSEEANSQVYREKIWNTYQSTLETRMQAGGAKIIILTRWHEDDIAGRILEGEDGKNWTVINLPALAEENDVLGRQLGEPLWPSQGYDEVWAADKKIKVGPYVWAALYQGRPTPPSGELLKKEWWKYYNFDPRQKANDFHEIVQSWDLSFKDTKGSARVSGQVWGRIDANCYKLDEVTELMDFPATIKAIRTMTGKWPMALKKYIEDKANGPAVIAVLKNKIPGIIPVEPEGGKVARAYAITGLLEARNVYLPAPERDPGTHDFIAECAAFPRGKYADRVDAMTQALVKWVMIVPRNTANEPTAEEAVSGGMHNANDIFGMGSDDSFFGDDELGELF
jgi:predicted phage terminase large subunit-like protein